MVNIKDVPKEFYDISLLFPKENDKSAETKRWLSKSAFTVGTVGLLSKFWLTCKFLKIYSTIEKNSYNLALAYKSTVDVYL